MTFARHLSLEEKREANRLKQQKYRRDNPEYFRAVNKKRYWARRKAQAHAATFAGRKCRLCGIPLDTPHHGARGTKVHCASCADNRRLINRLRMREWRARQLA